MHKRNIAKCTIQTYKGHFIATMAGVSDNFPIHQWHELVPQVVLTLNLLRQSHVAPTILAYAYHHGTFGYNRMPLAPMGCAVQFHIKPNRRKTWGEHSSDGWYLTTSRDHYRCHYIFVKATRAKRISDTIYFKHKHITQPSLMTEDLIIKRPSPDSVCTFKRNTQNKSSGTGRQPDPLEKALRTRQRKKNYWMPRLKPWSLPR
jgi:hypothetical protein